MPELVNVPVPFHTPVYSGLPEHAELIVEGEVLNAHEKAIWIEFYSGSNIPLHLTIRFGYLNGRNEILVNSLENGRWGHEDIHRQTVSIGGSLYVRVGITGSRYEIDVNGATFSFKHRLPIYSVDRFEVRGDVRVSRLAFNNFDNHVQVYGQPQPYNPVYPSYPPHSTYPQPGYNPGYDRNPLPGSDECCQHSHDNVNRDIPIGGGASLGYTPEFGGSSHYQPPNSDPRGY